MVKNVKAMYDCLDKIPACDRQTDRQTGGQTDEQTYCHVMVRAMHTRRAVIEVFCAFNWFGDLPIRVLIKQTTHLGLQVCTVAHVKKDKCNLYLILSYNTT